MQYEVKSAALEAERVLLSGQNLYAVAVDGKVHLVPGDVFDLFFRLGNDVQALKRNKSNLEISAMARCFYPRKGEWRSPKPNSGRRCLACGQTPAGIQFLQVSIFRGDDEDFALCKGCKGKLDAVSIARLKKVL